MKYLCFFLLLLSIHACNGRGNQIHNEEQAAPHAYEAVAVPLPISDPQEQVNYQAAHHWDKYNFKDTACLHIPEVTDQALSQYIRILQDVSPEVAALSIRNMMQKAETDSLVFHYFTDKLEAYLYDPNSSLQNEELYIPVLEYLVESDFLNETEKIRPAHLLELVLRNRMGTPATDFTYTLVDGRSGKLYGIKSDFVLLYFYNPDCNSCVEITQKIESSKVISSLEENKQLQVLAVYTEDDLQSWRNHLSAMPRNWIVAYDKSMKLKEEEVYDLKAIPTLYVLGKDKKVLLKDPVFREIEDYLFHISNP